MVSQTVPVTEHSDSSTADTPQLSTLTVENGRVSVPMDHALLDADFLRMGHDLLIDAHDQLSYLVRDYFGADAHPDLYSEAGFRLTGDMVNRLAGPLAPAQYAGPQSAGETIGTVQKLVGEVIVKHADGSETALKQGDPVFQDDVIKTGKDAALGLSFKDGSVFSLGADARMTIDELVYDPKTGEGHSDVSVVKGMFNFVSGDIAANNPGEMKVHTPVATLGIRGTTGGGNVQGEGAENQFYLTNNADGTVGWIDVTTNAGTQSLNQPSFSVNITNINQAPPAPIYVPPAQLQQQFAPVMQMTPANKYDNQQQTQDAADTQQQQNAEAQQQGEQQPNAAEAQTTAEQQQATADTQAPVQGEQNAQAFSGEQNFDGQANAEPEAPVMGEFTPVGVASADAIPGFTAADQTNFIAKPTDQVAGQFIQGQQLQTQGAAAQINPEFAALGPVGPAANQPVGGLPPLAPPPVAPLGALAPAANTAPAAPPPNGTFIANQLPPAGANTLPPPPPPGANTLPPPPPPGANTLPPPPPPTSPNAGGGGGGGGTTAASMTLALGAGNDSLLGATGADNFTVSVLADFNIGDTLVGGAGEDRITFSSAVDNIAIPPANFANTTGVDRLVFEGNNVSFTTSTHLTNYSDSRNVFLDHGSNDVNLTLAHDPLVGRYSMLGNGTVTLNGGGVLYMNGGETGGAVYGLDSPAKTVVVTGGNTKSVNLGSGTDSLHINGGTAHTLSGGAGSDRFFVNGGSQHSIDGGTGGDYIQVSNLSQSTIRGGTSNNDDQIFANNLTNSIIEGQDGGDSIEVHGTNSGLTISGGVVGTDDTASDEILLENFSGDAYVYTYAGTSPSNSDVISVGNLSSANITINNQSSGAEHTEFNWYGKAFSDLTLSRSGNDMVMSNGGSQVKLSNFFNAPNNNNRIDFYGEERNPFAILQGPSDYRDMSNMEYQFLNRAVGKIVIGSLPADGETVIIGGTTFTFRTTASTSTEIQIGVSAAATAQNLEATLSGYGLPGVTVKYNSIASPSAVYFISTTEGGDVAGFFTAGTAPVSFSNTDLQWIDPTGGSRSNGQNILFGGVGNDTLTAIGSGQGVYGGAGDDLLIQSGSILNTLYGGEGNDTFRKSGSGVTMDGGSGFDMVDYSSSGTAVNVSNLASGGNGDNYVSIEGVMGSNNATGDTLSGGAGNEWFEGGVGADTIDGGGGLDTASYIHSDTGVNVTLGAPSQANGHAQGDVLTNIENIVGSQFVDDLNGDATGNIIMGMNGNDAIYGFGGADTLLGGQGNDIINLNNGGGVDAACDIVMFEANPGTDTINDFKVTGPNSDIIDITKLLYTAVGPSVDLFRMNYFDLVDKGYLLSSINAGNTELSIDSNGSLGGGTIINYAVINGVDGTAGNKLDWRHFLTGSEEGGTPGIPSDYDDVLIAPSSYAYDGQDGNDILANNGFAAVTLDGGWGNDTYVLNGAFATGTNSMNGGEEYDTVRFANAAAQTYDFSSTLSPTLQNIERLVINDGNTIISNLSRTNVIQMTDGNHTLKIDGLAGSTSFFDNLSQWGQVNAGNAPPGVNVESGYTTYVSYDGNGVIATVQVQN